MQQVPSQDPCDPGYRRLRYVRYADDWLLGLSGPRHEAEEIKRQIGLFLREHLKLELSETKTLITHARTQTARFLGYAIVIRHNDHKHDQRGQRSLNGKVGLKGPLDVVRDQCARYRQHGKPIHRMDLLHDTTYSIVAQYQQEYRGVVAYYQLAGSLYQFNRLKWLMERSLTQTLAHKLDLSVNQVYHRYRATLQTDQGPRARLQVTVRPSVGGTDAGPVARTAPRCEARTQRTRVVASAVVHAALHRIVPASIPTAGRAGFGGASAAATGPARGVSRGVRAAPAARHSYRR
jgi:Type II intron maturase